MIPGTSRRFILSLSFESAPTPQQMQEVSSSVTAAVARALNVPESVVQVAYDINGMSTGGRKLQEVSLELEVTIDQINKGQLVIKVG